MITVIASGLVLAGTALSQAVPAGGATAPVVPAAASEAHATAASPRDLAQALERYVASVAAPERRGPAPRLRVDPAWRSPGPSPTPERAADIPVDSLNAVVEQYCVRCHSDTRLRGNLSLSDFDVASAPQNAEVAEKMIMKLRAGMMPMPGARRPGPDTLLALVETLETLIDDAAEAAPYTGGRPFQRLNRAEYESSIRDLLGLGINAGDYLPLDTKSDNFDNIADVQMMSPTLISSYLNAAEEISRLALGDPNAGSADQKYTVSGYASQMDRIDGAPFGTRGGISVEHIFPADGDYVFAMTFEHTTTGDGFFGRIARFEKLEVSVNGERVALLDVDQWMTFKDADVISMETEPIFVPAGPQRVTAAFLKRTEGPAEDLVSPHDWSLADRHTGISGYGLTFLPHLRDLIVSGPKTVTGVSDTPTRQRIFTCYPESSADERPCAREVLAKLAARAYRRPLEDRDIDILMSFFEEGAAADGAGFEGGIRTGLQAILASPHFIFRFEEPTVPTGPDTRAYRVGDHDLASRLSFFLWGAPPDDALVSLATASELAKPGVLRAQVERMLEDDRASTLGQRFAGQWLRLQDLEKVHPDAFWFPDFDAQLADGLRHETELFFNSLVKEDRSVLDLYDADYTFLNERLAVHYGIPGVIGNHFRKVNYPDRRRGGLLGHGSILTLTSHAGRTSPVLRGKWVMEVLLGTPPPPPPPGIPELEETDGSTGARMLTTRERMELHRANPACSSCHKFMDPIGLALDNFDVTGRWRIRENGVPLDTRGEMYDGTPVESPADLRQALLKRPEPLLRTFAANLMAYALGRRVEYYDQPTVRAIVSRAGEDDYRMSAFILGVVTSDAFQMQGIQPAVVEDGSGGAR